MPTINKALFAGMITGITLALFSPSCLGACLGLELNLLCFIPLLTNHSDQGPDSGLKYFLIQTWGSLILLAGGLMVSLALGSCLLVMLALFLKIGSAPFHWWYLSILGEAKWSMFLLLSVFQKIAPLALIFYSMLFISSAYLWIIIILCSSVGGVGGISEMSLRKILGYSSISHMGWMYLPMATQSLSWVIYFLVYAILVLLLILNSWKNQVFHLTQSKMQSMCKASSTSLVISLFSIMGAPPFIGFLPKWVVVKASLSGSPWGLLYFMILMNIITLFYYLRWSVSNLFFYLQLSSSNFKKGSFLDQFSLVFNFLGLLLASGAWVSFLH